MREIARIDSEAPLSEIISFGVWVQTRRNQLHMSRPTLARRIACAPITIKKIERDERRPSEQLAELLALHLQVPDTEKEKFIRRARGEFVLSLTSPQEMSLAEAQAESAPAPKHNLPPQATSFAGRRPELATIASQLADPGCRLLTIQGPGGMGKSRLAIEAGLQQLTGFTDGVLFVPLTGITAEIGNGRINPIAAALTDATRITFYGNKSLESQLITYLSRKEQLLILDNLEHLLDAVPFLSALLHGAPDLKILATSRERLQLQEEWLISLAGLPHPVEPISTKGLEYASIQLFAERARQVKANFDLESELPDVVRLCHLLAGMPLGIELAAALVRQLPCRRIVDELQQEIDILENQLRNLPERHRSLRALFEHAWQGLNEVEQLIAQKLSVFQDGFEPDAADAVAGASFRQLSRLVDKSLLQVTGTGRYFIHTLLRQFLAEKLAEIPARQEQAIIDHSHHFLTLISQEEIQIFTPQADQVRGLIRQDIGNVRAALDTILEREYHLIQYSTFPLLYWFYESEGWFLEGTATFSHITTRLETIISGGDKGNSEPLRLALIVSRAIEGWFQAKLGQFEAAADNLAQAVPNEINRHADIVRGFVGVLWSNVLLLCGRYDEAIEQIAVSRVVFKKRDHKMWYQISLSLSGGISYFAGDLTSAEEFIAKSRHGVPELGSPQVDYNLRMLGGIAMARGDYPKAETVLTKSLNGHLQNGRLSQVIYAQLDLGNALRLQGKLEAAGKAFEEARVMSTETEMLLGESMAHWGLGNLATDSGNFEAAEYHFNQSAKLDNYPPRSTGGPGWSAIQAGDFDKAKHLLTLQLSACLSRKQTVAGLDRIAGLAFIFAQQGELAEALAIIAMLMHHSATTFESKDKIRALRAQLAAQLPAETVAAAEQDGSTRALWPSVKMILTNLESS